MAYNKYITGIRTYNKFCSYTERTSIRICQAFTSYMLEIVVKLLSDQPLGYFSLKEMLRTASVSLNVLLTLDTFIVERINIRF